MADMNDTIPRAAPQNSSRPQAEVHSHLSIKVIQRRLHLHHSPVRMLLWLAKTDYFVMSMCPTTTRNQLVALGMMVLFTMMLAFFSALYTVKSALIPPDHVLAWPASIVLALVYAYGVMVIDREIVGSTKTSWWSYLIRLVFALVIAAAVSYPVKLLFFEGRIVNEIDEMVQEENSSLLTRIDELKATVERERREERDNIQGLIASQDKLIANLDAEIERERRDEYCGPKCQAFIVQRDDAVREHNVLTERLATFTATAALPKEVREEVDRLQSVVDGRTRVAYDFLYKAQALDRIGDEVGASYQMLSWFLFTFFVLLEVIPLFLKLSLGKTEYHYYIDARSRINAQKTVSIANYYLERMQDDGGEGWKDVPNDISEIIAGAMEDEAAPSARRFRSETIGETTRLVDANQPVTGQFEGDTQRNPGPTDGGRNG